MNTNDSHPLFSREVQELLDAERGVPTLPEPERSALVGRVLSASVNAALPNESWWRQQGIKRWAAIFGVVVFSSGMVWAKYSGVLGPTEAPPQAVSQPLPAALPAGAAVPGRPDASGAGDPSVELPAQPPDATPKAVSSAIHSGKSDLPRDRAELAGLEEARAAQQHGDFTGALRAIEAHERRFPRSIFAEDREALRVSALGKLGRTADARARARAFVARYPRSVFIAKLEPWLDR